MQIFVVHDFVLISKFPLMFQYVILRYDVTCMYTCGLSAPPERKPVHVGRLGITTVLQSGLMLPRTGGRTDLRPEQSCRASLGEPLKV